MPLLKPVSTKVSQSPQSLPHGRYGWQMGRCPSLPLLTTAMSSVLITEKADLGHGMLSQLGHQAKLATSHSACH